MVRRRHRAEVEQVRPRARGACGRRRRRCGCSAPGNPPLHRFRVGLEFALSGPPRGRRHDRPPRRRSRGRSASSSGCPTAVLEALGAAYEQWDGRGLAGRARGRATCRSRRGSRSSAEFVEVAHRVGGVEAAKALARERARQAVRSRARRRWCAPRPSMILAGLDDVGTWDAVIDAEPALAVVLSGERFDAALAGDRELRRPEVAVHARPRARRRRARGRGRGAARPRRATTVRTLRRAGLVHDLGRLGVSNAIWDKPGPLGAGEWERVRHAPVPDRAHAPPVAGAGAARRDRRAAPRAPRRLGLPARALRRRDLAPGADPRRGRRLPGDARAAALPPGALGRRGGRRAARRGQGRPARRRRRRGGARRRRPSRRRAAARARPA